MIEVNATTTSQVIFTAPFTGIYGVIAEFESGEPVKFSSPRLASEFGAGTGTLNAHLYLAANDTVTARCLTGTGTTRLAMVSLGDDLR
jgi:hypothetical protein